MLIMPIVYVSDIQRSLAFYQLLGFEFLRMERNGGWAELGLGGGLLGLHYSEHLPEAKNQRVELTLCSQEPLRELQERLVAAGISLERSVTDEAFGYSLVVRDPDGLSIQINERDYELYT